MNENQLFTTLAVIIAQPLLSFHKIDLMQIQFRSLASLKTKKAVNTFALCVCGIVGRNRNITRLFYASKRKRIQFQLFFSFLSFRSKHKSMIVVSPIISQYEFLMFAKHKKIVYLKKCKSFLALCAQT
jgi:hypothetical protein